MPSWKNISGAPVWPLPKVCRAFFTWMDCVAANNVEAQKSGELLTHGQSYWMHFARMRIDIEKPNLLGRLLVAKEKVRTEKCPIHNGRYSSSAIFDNPCPHKCDGTGWLRADPNVGGYKREFIEADDWKIVDGKLMIKDSHKGEWKILATDAEKTS